MGGGESTVWKAPRDTACFFRMVKVCVPLFIRPRSRMSRVRLFFLYVRPRTQEHRPCASLRLFFVGRFFLHGILKPNKTIRAKTHDQNKQTIWPTAAFSSLPSCCVPLLPRLLHMIYIQCIHPCIHAYIHAEPLVARRAPLVYVNVWKSDLRAFPYLFFFSLLLLVGYGSIRVF